MNQPENILDDYAETPEVYTIWTKIKHVMAASCLFSWSYIVARLFYSKDQVNHAIDRAIALIAHYIPF